MKARIVVAIALLLLCLPTLSFAYDEPDNFAGVKFGVDVRTQLPDCRAVFRDFERKLKTLDDVYNTRCYEDGSSSLEHMGEIQRLVRIIFFGEVHSKLEQIELIFPSISAGALLTVLKQRYGEPTSTSQLPWKSLSGIETTNTHVEWQGKNVSIAFDERKSKINEGRIEYTTSAYREWAAKQAEERLKKSAGEL